MYKESNEVLVKLWVSLIITEQCGKAIAYWFYQQLDKCYIIQQRGTLC